MEKKLYRNMDDAMIFGVASGLADYFDVDVSLVRIIFILLAVWGGAGVLIYIIGAIAIPEAPGRKGEDMADKKNVKGVKKVEPKRTKVVAEEVTVREPRRWQGEQIFGMIVLILGVIFLLEAFIPGFSFGKLWPVILIAIGLWLLAGKENR